MSAPERLRQIIEAQRTYLRAQVPSDHAAAVTALVRAQDAIPHVPATPASHHLVTGRQLANLAGNEALHLCLTSSDGEAPSPPDAERWTRWAAWFRHECAQLVEAEQVLTHCETGFIRLAEERSGAFDAWIATKRAPTSWLERADFDWWAASIASAPPGGGGKTQAPAAQSREKASARARDAAAANGGNTAHQHNSPTSAHLAHQLGYPLDAVLGGSTIQRHLDVLRWLTTRAHTAHERSELALPQSERTLIDALAADLRVAPASISQVVDAFILDATNAAHHAAVPGIAAAPLVRAAPDRVVLSLHGLTREPLLFLTRELRRRDAEGYNNTAHLREAVFREDLYALFNDKRFVTSTTRLELRRDSGTLRTDIDAVVFDRKTGTLGVFELKSQDPFARSTAELIRQRDNVLYANRQVAGVLAWLNRNGAADELLNRVDRRTAQTFRVHRVYPFVLGRYLAHFIDSPEPDRRAAWGTWPQLLRLLDGQPAGGANPIASLFTRLSKDLPIITPPTSGAAKVITLGDTHLTVHPTLAAYQASQGVRRP